MKSYLAKFKIFQRKITFNTFHIILLIDSFIVLRFKHEPLARVTGQPCLEYDNKLNFNFCDLYTQSIQTLFWVIFEELPFCHFPPPNTSLRGKDSKI